MRRSVIKLLEDPEIEGYPTEYLISRIKGRRAYLINDWDGLIITPSPIEYLHRTRYKESIDEYSMNGIWSFLWSEYRWLYRQMNEGLRKDLYHLFLYLEFKRLIICLRHKLNKEKNDKIALLLRFSLLSKDIKRMLIEDELSRIIEWLEDMDIKGLREEFSEKGISSLEERLMDLFFDSISTVNLHPLIREVFNYIIDLTNIMTLFKYHRWHIEVPPSFIKGGSLDRDNLLRKGMDAITPLIQRLTGIRKEDIRYSNIEAIMRNGLIKIAKRMRMEGSDIGIILDYIIRLNNEVENLGIILYGEGLERDVIDEELVVLK